MKNQIEKLLENFVPEGQQEKTDFKVFQDFAADEKNLNRSSIAHFTASVFVLNESHDKILGIYHKIYQSWGWVGGHADGNADLLAVAVKEVQEETGLRSFKNFQKCQFQLKPYLFLDIITENMVMSVLIFILMLLFYLKQRKVIHFKRIRMKQGD